MHSCLGVVVIKNQVESYIPAEYFQGASSANAEVEDTILAECQRNNNILLVLNHKHSGKVIKSALNL